MHAEWRRLGNVALGVALLTAPLLFAGLTAQAGWSLAPALVITLVGVAAVRGLFDVVSHKLIPRPSMFGLDRELADKDIVARRRLWTWRTFYRWLIGAAILSVLVTSLIVLISAIGGGSATFGDGWHQFVDVLKVLGPFALSTLPQLVAFFLINLVIFIGPLMFFSVKQIKAYEPGDAEWGVKLDDVRGQADARGEIEKIVQLWQSGEEFERLGGKRERGVLFLGAPGTGKTMLAKAIATGFACPFVTIPGSGFQQMFMGMDALVVRYLAWRAKRLARKWGGQCIVFIDEIDAVGMRRSSLAGAGYAQPHTIHDTLFYGAMGALTPDGEQIYETRAWREKLFAARAPRPPEPSALWKRVNQYIYPGMGGGMGSQGLQQLLIVMDGIDDPPGLRRWRTKRLNTWLDALYLIPQRLGPIKLRLRAPRPRKDQEVFFIGACNVPLEQLDPALTRPGRMGRHIHFRTPAADDRRDIFDLYLDKVAHEPDLDSDHRRDEIARMTSGYSPAMIDQVCSLALTYAHSDRRERFGWDDLLEAMTVVEAGVAIETPYPPHESRSIAIHEAGHAVCSHLYAENVESTRLSIRKRGSTGGMHVFMEKEERFVNWRRERVARLISSLGAMAAEYVFYGENTTGVAGDVHASTSMAVEMVAHAAMGPERVDLSDRFPDRRERVVAEREIRERYLELGTMLMHRSGSALQGDPIAVVLADEDKRDLVAGLLGQAFVTAYAAIRANRDGVDAVAATLVERKEIHGNELVDLLDRHALVKPEIDVFDEATWPAI